MKNELEIPAVGAYYSPQETIISKERDNMYLVTGGAGFIGSHLVKALNDRGCDDVVVVDDLSHGAKFGNLADCRIADYYDKDDVFLALSEGHLPLTPSVILHQGACTNTMEYDGRYMMETNFTFSKLLLEYSIRNAVPFVYASSAAVYGSSRESREIPENERPLNVYGYSKLAFDQYVRRRLSAAESTIVGLRYFNVYGPRETRKGKMASMVYQLYCQLRDNGIARLFQGTDGFGDGEQRRDFVFVKDLVKVNLFFAEQESCRTIVNVGSGASRSFNDVARCLIDLLGTGRIEYIPFDETLRGKYQSFTQSDLTSLRAANYEGAFTPLEHGIAECVEQWEGLCSMQVP